MTRNTFPITMTAVLLGALTLGTSANASQALRRFSQSEQRDNYGRLTVEASIVTEIYCNGNGENLGRFYIYQYLNRPGFRAIQPPYWANAIGGRDWATYEQSTSAACHSGMSTAGTTVTSNPTMLAGEWMLATGCGYPTRDKQNFWELLTLKEDPAGRVSGGPAGGNTPQISNLYSLLDTGDKVNYRSGNSVHLVLWPDGWVSNLILDGVMNGNRIDGTITHYGKVDCRFTMTRR